MCEPSAFEGCATPTDRYQNSISACRDFGNHTETSPDTIAELLQPAEALGALTARATMRPGEARGPLAGVPFVVKDNIDVAGLPTTAGTPSLDRNLPVQSASVVRRLVDAGALAVAKTNMHELALGVTSNNPTFGPVRNPADRVRTAGGSSGGSAAAVAAGSVPFALGTDTGGSVRIPAAFCGIVGFRPSTDRYPSDGAVSVSWTRDTVGILANTVRDIIAVDHVIHGDTYSDAPMASPRRLGMPLDLWRDLDPVVEQKAHAALDTLSHHGVEVVPIVLGALRDAVFEAGIAILNYEKARLLPAYFNRVLDTGGRQLDLAGVAGLIASPDVRDLVSEAAQSPVSHTEYEHMQSLCDTLRSSLRRVFAATGVEALAYPTVVTTAPVTGEDRVLTHNGRTTDLLRTIVANTTQSTVLGTPSISLPVGGFTAGLPVGISLEGLPGQDAELLHTAWSVEALLAADPEGRG